jgi:hypothetical protein
LWSGANRLSGEVAKKVTIMASSTRPRAMTRGRIMRRRLSSSSTFKVSRKPMLETAATNVALLLTKWAKCGAIASWTLCVRVL